MVRAACTANHWLVTAALVGAVGLTGCAHTDGATEDTPPKAQETEILRERVRHLERRVSDLDAQITLLTEKVATDGPRPERREAPPQRRQVRDFGSAPAEITHEGDHVERVGMGMKSIDLAPRPLPPRPPPPADAWSAPNRTQLTPEQALAAVAAERASSSSGAPTGSVKEIYDWALQRLQAGQYLPAIAAFEDVLERFPTHHLADNALYWSAVGHGRRGEPRMAIEVFQTLPMRFPESPKTPDSLYEMALAYEALGEPKLAQSFYSQLLSQFPSADRGADARQALRRLR